MEKYNLDTSTVALDKSLVESQYTKMEVDREQYLERARELAKLTIPHLYPPTGANQATEYPTPYQSVGSRGVTNLASKLMLALFPPQAPFFRLDVDELVYKQIEADPQQKQTIEQGLAKIEKAVMDSIESNNDRVAVYEALKHLIVSGNVLTYLPKKGSMRVFPLSQYVVQRDSSGNVCEIIVQEKMSIMSLDKNVASEITSDPDYKKDSEIELYTHVYKLDDSKFYVCQEANGVKIPSSIGTFTKERMPYQALRMIRVDNEDYGRGYVEEFLGDLKSLEGLSQSLVESAAASSKVVFMVRPNAVTRKKDLSLSRNGDIITGSKDDVSVLQAEKQYDLQVVERSIQKLEERLSFAFLLHTAIQRNAERVTAQEIRYMAEQLETAMGGIYSLLSQEFQLPLVTILMKRMEQANEIPSLPEKSVRPTIITGIEALGRGNDLQKLREFVAEIGNLAQINPAVVQSLNPDDLIKRIATGLGIETEGLIKSQEQMAQEQEAQEEQMQNEQMMQMAEKAVAPVANNATKPQPQ